MKPRTHLYIDPDLCGRPTDLGPGRATVELQTGPSMAADAQGLVHGGFIFGAADYAAMLAVNDPHVVLGASDCRFTAPVPVGATVKCEAEVVETKGKKRIVSVSCAAGDTVVLTGTFTTFVLDAHVLAGRSR